MNLFTNLLCMASAGVLGYVAEPKLRFQLTGMQPSATEYAKSTAITLRMPDGTLIDTTKLTAEQLPQRVLLKTDVIVANAASGKKQIIQAGEQAKLVRIEGGNVVVSPDDVSFTGLLPLVNTDLVEQIAAGPIAAPEAAPPVPDVPPAPPEPVTPPLPVVPEPVTPPPPVVPEPITPPPPIEPDPVAPTQPTIDPAPAPEATPSGPESAPPTEDAVQETVKLMQASLKAAEIKEFTFDQVTEWTSGTDEIHDGQNYQIGLASYKATTIFGEKIIPVKALIKDGKVQRWIWPKSGKTIK